MSGGIGNITSTANLMRRHKEEASPPLLFLLIIFSFIMAFLSIVHPSPQIYLRTKLHGIGYASSDAELRENLRLITAILLAKWSDTNPNLDGIRGILFDVITNEFFYHNGYAKAVDGTDERLWFCSYVGFEQITSKWAKEKHPGCKGYISMRLFNRDAKQQELDSHTVQIYF